MEAVLEAEQKRRLSENRLAYYRPYAKQTAFHEAGVSYRERLLMAGNQLGKTVAGGAEAAMHATGRYPDGGRAASSTSLRLPGSAVRPR